MEKLLKDYPQKKWLEAADGCDCGAKYKVRIKWVDESGCFGDVEYKIHHRKDCPETYEWSHGVHGSLQEVAGWTFKKKTITLKGKTFTPLASRANVGPCLNCGKLIVGVPLILFIEKGGTEFIFI